jgi:gliding motility-associated-like protein
LQCTSFLISKFLIMNFFKFLAIAFFVIIVSNKQIRAQGDNCGGAVKITGITKYCSTDAQFSNAGFTASIWPLALCWPADAENDAWFSFTAIGTDVQISVTGGGTKGTIRKPNIELTSGDCTTQSSIACSAQNTTNATSLYKGSLVPGTIYFIRVSTNDANRGSFTLCISNYIPTVNPGADCDGAVKLCDKSVVSVAGLSGGGKNNKEIEANSCFNTATSKNALESNSSWYKWTCAKAGTLTFDIAPIDPTNDLDFILYELSDSSTDACGKRTIIRCTATGCPVAKGIVGLNMTATDVSEPFTNAGDPNACNSTALNGYLKYVDMVAGKTYVLMVNNFSTASGFTITFGGNGILLGPKAVITASNVAQLCKGETVTFNGNLSTHYDALKWTFTPGIPNTATTVGPHTITYNTTGTYTAYLKASDATCASGNSIDSAKVTVNAPPVIDASAPVITSTDCNAPTGSIKGITVTGGKLAYTYDWYALPATKVSTSTTTADLIAMLPGNYFLVVTDANGCKDTTANFEIKSYTPPVLPNVLNNIAYCKGDVLGPITADGKGGTYTWFGDIMLKDTLYTGAVYTPVNTVTDTLYLTETAHGCTSQALAVIIMIKPLPIATAADMAYCAGETLKPITANGNSSTYNWFGDAALKNLLYTGTTYTPLNTVTDTIYLTGTSDGCNSYTDTVIITINPLPIADAGVTKHIVCTSPTVTLDGSGSGGAPPLEYSWTPLSGVVSGSNTITPTVKTAGTYTLTVKNTLTGCTVTDQVDVIKDPVPFASFTANVYSGEDPLTVNFNNTSTGANTYQWIFDGDNKSTDKNPVFVYKIPNTFTVLLICSDSTKCPDTTTAEIRVFERFTVEIPNVFTPNGDGINDVFTINSTGIQELSCEIYDRWGLKIYSWDRKNDGWDGRTLSGSKATEGTYFFILKIKPLGDGKAPFIKSGYLTLLR